ncbi:MAG: hypothetical protein QXU98_14665 [Candidatus Parvarchaeota archaeon]
MSSNALANLNQIVSTLETLENKISETAVPIVARFDRLANEIEELWHSALHEGFVGYIVESRKVCTYAYRWAYMYRNALEVYFSPPEKRGPFKFEEVFPNVEISQRYVSDTVLAFNQALDEYIFGISTIAEEYKDLFEELLGENYINLLAEYLNLLRQFQDALNKFADEAVKLLS